MPNRQHPLTKTHLESPNQMTAQYCPSWILNPAVDFLNHGSFGAAPLVVMEAQQAWIRELERDPIDFLAPERTLLPKLDRVRQLIAKLLNAASDDIVFVRNATEGVNAVLRSFPLQTADEVLITNHGYNACNNAVRFAAERVGAVVTVADVPFPIASPTVVIDAVAKKLTARTRLILIDHVTSPTALLFPVAQIVQLAHGRGIRVMIDGAHAPGMVGVDLQAIDADYYTANHHKWLCGPKTSGLLWVRPQWQSEVRPTVISHGANRMHYGNSRFQAEFNWIGTYDPSPILSMPTAIEFLDGLYPGGLVELMERNRALALIGRQILLDRFSIDPPAPDAMLGSMATIPLPSADSLSEKDVRAWQQSLFLRDRIEVPVFKTIGQQTCARISAQAYNDQQQYERLANALSTGP